jgi:hypothetical protein
MRTPLRPDIYRPSRARQVAFPEKVTYTQLIPPPLHVPMTLVDFVSIRGHKMTIVVPTSISIHEPGYIPYVDLDEFASK